MTGPTLLLVCVVGLTQLTSASAGPHAAAPLLELPRAQLGICERSGLMRPACPRLVPKIRGAYASNLAVELTGPWILDVFNLERGGEDPANPEHNRPPGMAHVVAVAGNVERLAAFREPRGATGEPVRDGIMRSSREAPVSFGRVRWAVRGGALYLMPPFPRGGMLGNHLVFSWTEKERRHVLSLHAWEPLTQSIATLRAMVESLPTPSDAARLAHLSPVRRLVLPRGAAIARERIPAPLPRRHAFDVFVVVPARADIGVRIETPGGGRLRILDSTRSPLCRTRRPFRLCLLHFPRLEAVAGDTWTLVLTKRSIAPARVRVDVNFR